MKKGFLVFSLAICVGVCSGQAFQKMKIDHIAISVINLKEAGKFYMNILGLDTIPEPFHDGRHYWFNLGGGVQMHMIQGAEKAKEYYQNDHLCLRTDNVVAFTKKLEANEIGASLRTSFAGFV